MMDIHEFAFTFLTCLLGVGTLVTAFFVCKEMKKLP